MKAAVHGAILGSGALTLPKAVAGNTAFVGLRGSRSAAAQLAAAAGESSGRAAGPGAERAAEGPVSGRAAAGATGLALAALGARAAHRRVAQQRRTAATRRRSLAGLTASWGQPSPLNQGGFRDEPEKLIEPTKLMNECDIFIFDCDGVIWRGDSVIPGIPSVLDKLRAANKTMFFVTNNSTKSRAGYKAKFTSLGLDVQPEEIFSSSFAAAAYMEQTKFKDTGKKVYIIGEKGISEELDLIGVPWIGAEADAGKAPNMGKGGTVEIDKDVGAVIVGFDRNINYHKIQYAQLAINENGAEFIATNMDRVTHLTDAQEWAGNASMAGAISGCTGQDPKVVGKPSPLIVDYISEKYGITDRKRICMVGDRLDTDILFGRDNGMKTCLTLTGVTTQEKLLSPDNNICPDYYVDSINDFFK